ncbi:helix-turn-helix domain-containing protein [Paenibacillus sp. SEL3]
MENYILISLHQGGHFQGTLLLGPSISSALPDSKILGIINDLHFGAQREQILNYYHTVPVIPRDTLLEICTLVFHMVTQKMISPKEIINEINTALSSNLKFHTEAETAKTRQTSDFHQDPLLEKKLFNIIREGRIEDFKNFGNDFGDKVGVLSKSSFIRSKKNLAITSITLATRSSIEGGVLSEQAFSLSDLFIQRLEEMNKSEEIDQFLVEALLTFTQKVRQAKERRYSKTITMCQNFIHNHLYSKINHEQIANYVKLSPGYLSILFKKEVGVSVSEYIQQARIDEAKNLLAFTDRPITEIGELLSFTDQSYFTKMFKKMTGVTPRKYRENPHTLEIM